VCGTEWLDKVLQLYQIQNIHHGLMLVGPAGSGKSAAWRVLLAAMHRLHSDPVMHYVIDPKARAPPTAVLHGRV
jgi:dynein heavy chain 1